MDYEPSSPSYFDSDNEDYQPDYESPYESDNESCNQNEIKNIGEYFQFSQHFIDVIRYAGFDGTNCINDFEYLECYSNNKNSILDMLRKYVIQVSEEENKEIKKILVLVLFEILNIKKVRELVSSLNCFSQTVRNKYKELILDEDDDQFFKESMSRYTFYEL